MSSRLSSVARRRPRVGTGARPRVESRADVELHVGVAHEQRLCIGVDRDELDALEALFDHPVDGIDATTANADDFDHGQVVVR